MPHSPRSTGLPILLMWKSKSKRRAAIYDRTRLNEGATIDGPAVVEQYDSTTVMLPGQRATVDSGGNLMVATRAARAESPKASAKVTA